MLRTFIAPYYETDLIYKSVASADKRLVEYENAGHESFFKNDPLTWIREIKSFLK
jgi:alpha-beta hydrolase superfamily lysophospholipase